MGQPPFSLPIPSQAVLSLQALPKPVLCQVLPSLWEGVRLRAVRGSVWGWPRLGL